jgi:hypothetical protein
LAPYFKELTRRKMRLAIIFGVLTIGLTFVYNFSRITPLPRLENQNADKVAQVINKQISPDNGLIIDFWDWEPTYYIGLHSKLPPQNIYMVSGDDKNKIPVNEINDILKNHQQGVILLVKNSVLWQNTSITDKSLQFKFTSVILNTREIYNNDEIEVWKYLEGM